MSTLAVTETHPGWDPMDELSEAFYLDDNGMIVETASDLGAITGFVRHELMMRSFSFLYEREEFFREKFLDDLLTLKTFGDLTCHRWFKRKDNGVFLAKVRVTRSDDGKYPGPYLVRLWDHTRDYLLKLQTKKSKRELRNLFYNTIVGIFRYRYSDGRILSMNDRAYSIFGVPKNVRHFQSVFSDDDTYSEFQRKLLMQPGISTIDVEVMSGSTLRQWASITCTLRPEDDIVEGMVQDISEAKRKMVELDRLNNELQSFIYHASHEFRSPLLSLLGLFQVARLEQPTPEVAGYLELMESQVRKMDSLLRNLTAIALNNSVGIVHEYFDLREEVERIVDALRIEFPGTRIVSSIYQYNEVNTDRVRLRTILRNILRNACQFIASDQTNHEVSLIVRNKRSVMTIAVSDNGIGISKNHIDRVFDLFGRFSNQSQGGGLGLYIVKNLVQGLGGRLRLMSAEGKGTTIVIRIPCNKQQ